MQPAMWSSGHTKQTELSRYAHLCAEIGPSYSQGLAMAAALKGTTVEAMLS